MRNARRLVLHAICAAAVAATVVLRPTPAHAAGQGTPQLGYFCAHLAEAIAYLESQPSGPVRDRLLAKAQWAWARHCE
jgi:hypothetical protein